MFSYPIVPRLIEKLWRTELIELKKRWYKMEVLRFYALTNKFWFCFVFRSLLSSKAEILQHRCSSKYSHGNWKSTDKWSYTCFKSIDFTVICLWNLLFLWKVANFLTVSLLSFLFINKKLLLNNLKTITAMKTKMSVFVICVEVIYYIICMNLSLKISQYSQENTCVGVYF